MKRSGEEAYTCRTSEIETEIQNGHIETEDCIKGCGLDRKSFGISSDSLLEVGFTKNLCSPHCYQNCPNIVDLYFNLAAGEGNNITPCVTRPINFDDVKICKSFLFNVYAGVFLPGLCASVGANARRQTAEIRSSGLVESGPLSSLLYAAASPQALAIAPFPQF